MVPHSQPPALGRGLVAQVLGSFFPRRNLSSNVTIKSPVQPQITAASSGETSHEIVGRRALEGQR